MARCRLIALFAAVREAISSIDRGHVPVLVCTLASAHAEKRVALVVGNAAYRYTDKLDNPVNDAQAMASRLSPFCRSGELSLRGMVAGEGSTTVERLSALHECARHEHLRSLVHRQRGAAD